MIQQERDNPILLSMDDKSDVKRMEYGSRIQQEANALTRTDSSYQIWDG